MTFPGFPIGYYNPFYSFPMVGGTYLPPLPSASLFQLPNVGIPLPPIGEIPVQAQVVNAAPPCISLKNPSCEEVQKLGYRLQAEKVEILEVSNISVDAAIALGHSLKNLPFKLRRLDLENVHEQSNFSFLIHAFLDPQCQVSILGMTNMTEEMADFLLSILVSDTYDFVIRNLPKEIVQEQKWGLSVHPLRKTLDLINANDNAIIILDEALSRKSIHLSLTNPSEKVASALVYNLKQRGDKIHITLSAFSKEAVEKLRPALEYLQDQELLITLRLNAFQEESATPLLPVLNKIGRLILEDPSEEIAVLVSPVLLLGKLKELHFNGISKESSARFAPFLPDPRSTLKCITIEQCEEESILLLCEAVMRREAHTHVRFRNLSDATVLNSLNQLWDLQAGRKERLFVEYPGCSETVQRKIAVFNRLTLCSIKRPAASPLKGAPNPKKQKGKA